jgi:hypothetical protein
MEGASRLIPDTMGRREEKRRGEKEEAADV